MRFRRLAAGLLACALLPAHALAVPQGQAAPQSGPGIDMKGRSLSVTGKIEAGTIEGDGSSMTVAAGDVARLLLAVLRDQANVMSDGAKCDGVNDDTAAFRKAISRGRPVVVPAPPFGATACIISGSLVPAYNGQTITGMLGSPTIKLVSPATMLFDLAGKSGVSILDMTLDGSAASAGGPFIRLSNANESRLQRLNLISPTGSAAVAAINISQASARNVVEDVRVTGAAGMAVNLTGAGVIGNSIRRLNLTGNGDFGVRLGEGASGNEVSNSYCNVSRIECFAMTGTAHHNRFAVLHAEAAGDNGISVSGYSNSVTGSITIRNYGAGIYVWGSSNTITGNHGLSNNQAKASWPCIGANADYGQTGQSNTIVANTCDDDQVTPTQYGITFKQPGYTAWASGVAVTANSYIVNGLNVYQASGAGTTGAAAPTHISGAVSDGGVTWTYRSSFMGDLGGYNSVAGNRVIRYAGSAPYADTGPLGTWRRNTLISQSGNYLSGPLAIVAPGATVTSQGYTQAADIQVFGNGTSNPGMVFNTTNPNYTGAITFGSGGVSLEGRLEYDGASQIWRIYSQGVSRVVFGATTFRPSNDNAVQLGTSSGRWQSVNSYGYQVVDRVAIDATGVFAPKLAGAPSTAPGAGQVRLFGLAGTTAGTCKLMAQAGTSAAAVTLLDNIGSGC